MNFLKYFAFIAVLVLCLFASQGEAGKKTDKAKHILHEAGKVIGDAGKIAAGAAAIGKAVG